MGIGYDEYTYKDRLIVGIMASIYFKTKIDIKVFQMCKIN